MFPALAGEFLTTGSPGKSNTRSILFYIFSQNLYSVYYVPGDNVKYISSFGCFTAWEY